MIDRALLALPGARAVLASLAALAFARAALTIAQALALSSVLVHVWEGGGLEGQLPLLALFAACFIGRQLVAWAQDVRAERYARRQADDLRDALLARLFAEGPRLVQEEGTGNVTALALEGTDQVEAYVRSMLPKMAGLFVVPACLLVCIFALDWVSGLIGLLMFPALVLQMTLLGHTARAEADARHAQFRVLANHFVDSLRGLETLKLFGRGRDRAQSIYSSSEEFREATMRTLRIATLSGAVLDVFSTLSLAGVSIMLGFRLLDGSLALFPALAALVLMPEYFRPIREFASDYHASLEGKTSLAALRAIVAPAASSGADGAASKPGEGAVCEGAAGEGAARRDGAAWVAAAPAGDGAASPGPVGPWTAESVLELADVAFAYPEHRALEGVSFRVEGFQKIAVVGGSGAGKSTLARLLAGFAEPESGRVLVDGRDVGALASPSWRSQVLYIPQNPYVFHATLRDNVAFYTPDASDDEVRRAVSVVGLDDLVAELPLGLDTPIGEGARELSGGQAQRIALARALLDRDRRVLVFDEPTAHLDIETEMELKERMLPLMEGRLVVFATHRLHWVHQMDRVLVMEGGRAVAFGEPRELCAPGGAVCELGQWGKEAGR